MSQSLAESWGAAPRLCAFVLHRFLGSTAHTECHNVLVLSGLLGGEQSVGQVWFCVVLLLHFGLGEHKGEKTAKD